LGIAGEVRIRTEKVAVRSLAGYLNGDLRTYTAVLIVHLRVGREGHTGRVGVREKAAGNLSWLN